VTGLNEFRPFEGVEHAPFAIGEGPAAILMVHGFGGSPAELRGLGEFFAGLGWHAEALLLPGFGPDILNLERVHPRDWYQAVHVAWQAIRSSYAPCYLMGYSMGAAVALNMVQELRPDGLILAAPFTRFPGWLTWIFPAIQWANPKIRPFKRANFADPRLREFIQKLLPGINLDDPEAQEFVKNKLALPVRTIHEILQMGRSGYQLAAGVNVSTLVLQGAQDTTVHPDSTRRLVDRMPAAFTTYREIPGTHELLPAPQSPSDTPVLQATLDWLPAASRLIPAAVSPPLAIPVEGSR
jgi:carboxylesterase